MPSYVPPKKNTQYIFFIALPSQANATSFQSSPTIASGDFKVSIDGGALANLATLPVVTPAASKMVKVTLSTSEMNGDNITFVASDASGAEWRDVVINIQTAAQQTDDLSTQASVAALTAYVDTEVAAIKAKTDNLPTDPADASDIATATAAIAGYIDTEVAAILAAVDTEVGAIKAKTDNLPTDPADASDIATATTAISGYIDTEVAAILAAVDTEVAAIKAKTDALPTDPADESSIQAAIAALNNISVANILAAAVEGSLDLQEVLRLILASVAGKSTGGGTTSVAFRDVADSKDRIAATVDTDGNRTAITLDPS